jgi:plasmid stabilization system protein ParE
VGAPLYDRYRRFVLTPFKYLVVYEVTDGSVGVLRVTHGIRDPETIQGELEGRRFD